MWYLLGSVSGLCCIVLKVLPDCVVSSGKRWRLVLYITALRSQECVLNISEDVFLQFVDHDTELRSI